MGWWVVVVVVVNSAATIGLILTLHGEDVSLYARYFFFSIFCHWC